MPSPSSAREELASVLAEQQEIRDNLVTVRATVAAIKASSTYRLVHVFRRIVPRPIPVLPAPRPRTRLTPLDPHDPLSDELARASSEFDRLDAELRQLRHELHHLQLSRPLRVWTAVRRRLRYLRHPVWAVSAAGRLLRNTPAPRAVAMAWRRLRWYELRLRFVAPASQDTNQPHADEAIRWLAPVRVSGDTRHPLLMHPTSAASYEVKVPPGGQVVADCALLPTAWDVNVGGVIFDLSITCARTGAQSRCTLQIDPGQRLVDRRWHRLALTPPAGTVDAVIRLATSVPQGAAGAKALAVWGEPHVEWPRTRAEMSRSVAVLVRRLRETGLRDTLRHVRGVQAADEQATLYREWIAAHTPTGPALAEMATAAGKLAYRPLFSVLTPVYNTDAAMLRACIESVVRQVYPKWELCLADDGSTNRATLAVLKEYEGHPQIKIAHLKGNKGISLATNAALEMATGEFLAMLDHDDELPPEALFEMASALNTTPELDFLYSDEDKLDAAGERCDACFKPDWSPEHFLSCMYTCHLMVLRTSLVRELGGFRAGFEGSQDYDLVLRVIERTDRIQHVPKILYHWRKTEGSTASSGLAKTWAHDAGQRALEDYVRRNGLDATVIPGPAPGLFRVRRRVKGRPLVSILIPTSGRPRDLGNRVVDLLINCVGSIVEKTTYDNYEFVIGDDGALPEHLEAFLRTVAVPVRRCSFPPPDGEFNYGKKLNFIASHARGDHFVLFNDDTELITPEWLEAMLEFSQQEAIGAVGPKLYFGDGRLQHIGIVLGVNGMAAHAFHGHAGSSPGYFSSAQIIRNYSSVTGACLMTRRALFEQLGGFASRFRLDFNDVDYCLRLRRLGYRVVFTPYAQLYHLEMTTSGGRKWDSEEVSYMLQTFAAECERDPYYNPNLTLNYPDYRVRV